MVGIRQKRLPLGPWGVTVSLPAPLAHSLRQRWVYRNVIRPAIELADGVSARFSPPP